MGYSFRHKLMDYLLILTLMFSTGGLLFVYNRNIATIFLLVLVLFILIFFGKKLLTRIFNASLIAFLSISCLFIVNYLFAISEQSVDKYAFYFLTLTISIFSVLHFTNNRDEKQFLDGLYIVLKIVMLQALLSFFVFFIVKNSLVSISSIYHDCDTFNYIFFYTTERNILNVFGFELCRIQGWFWEPGILQVYLNILFFLEAFIYKRNRLLLIITGFVILTTYSTTGIAILLVQVIIYIIKEIKRNILFIPIIIFLSVPVYLIFSYNIEEKMIGERESSFQKRLLDLTQPLSIALEYPFTGVGMDVIQFQKIRTEFYSLSIIGEWQKQVGIEMNSLTTEKGSSNSIMFLFAATGFPTTLLFIYMFFKQQFITQRKRLFTFIIFISVLSEPILLRPFFFMFIVSGFAYTFNKFTSNK